jgi:hypothetical protein
VIGTPFSATSVRTAPEIEDRLNERERVVLDENDPDAAQTRSFSLPASRWEGCDEDCHVKSQDSIDRRLVPEPGKRLPNARSDCRVERVTQSALRGAWRKAMSGPEMLQFEVIRTIAASLISVAIVLLWFVVTSRQ